MEEIRSDITNKIRNKILFKILHDIITTEMDVGVSCIICATEDSVADVFNNVIEGVYSNLSEWEKPNNL